MDISWMSQLIGKKVMTVERWEGCPCVIRLQDGWIVQIESLWRLLTSGTLVLTSRDEGQLFGRTSPVEALSDLSTKLQGREVSSVTVASGTADLSLVLGQHTLQAISESSGYECWQVEGPGGKLAVGLGGGDVALWD